MANRPYQQSRPFGLLRTGFGALKGGPLCSLRRHGAPFRLAEVFGFGRAQENQTWGTGTSDLVLWSPDGDSGRPVGKDECRWSPKGKPAGGVVSFGYFSLPRNSSWAKNK